MIKRFLVSIAILLSAALIENSLLSNLKFLPAVPDLVLLCSVYLSLINGRTFGELSGFSGGLFLDFLSGSPFGFNCVFRTVIGYIAGLFDKTLNYTGIFIPFLIGMISTFIKVFLVWILTFFFPNILTSYRIISVPFIFELVANSILSPFIFKLLASFKNIISFREEAVKG